MQSSRLSRKSKLNLLLVFFWIVYDERMENGNVALDQLLTQAVNDGASDLHIRVGIPPLIRRDGELWPLREYEKVTAEQASSLIDDSMTEQQKIDFMKRKAFDFAYSVDGVGHFRCAYFLQQGKTSMIYRSIPGNVPSLDQIQAPQCLIELSKRRKGLILVTGPTGAGKSTTLAAFLDYINATRREHILTIEDPIEYVYTPRLCNVNQREVGVDTPGFHDALRDGLREDPDVILVGEMRDLETTEIAIRAAETGHLVLGTLHTNDSVSTISRVIDQFTAEKQQQIRVMLAASLTAVISQTLVPRADGKGRIAAHEVLVCNDPVRANIRNGKLEQIRSTIQTSFNEGMQTMDRALAYYVHEGIIEEAIAEGHAVNVREFTQTLEDLKRGAHVARPDIIMSNPLAATAEALEALVAV